MLENWDGGETDGEERLRNGEGRYYIGDFKGRVVEFVVASEKERTV